MKKLYTCIFICSFFSVSYTYADFVARAVCLFTYTGSVTKCGPQPSLKNPLAYAKWAACTNAATAVYYACITRSYLPFVDDEYSESEYEK